ncbi:MAG: peptidase domain-containing ABC transporter [Deltaproteobacteria bacterium]|nr:peptidase domain-containing ABC transporter [Deltaproteobacteria bacterium]
MSEPVPDTVDENLAATLRKLGGRRHGRVPYIQQMEGADCGAACLAMVLGFHGRAVTLDETRQAAGTNRGTDALGIVRGAESLGMRSRGVQVEIESLHYLPPASILHWDFNHFVVFERVTRRGVDIVDPAHGRRTIPMDRFRRHFTGVALVFEPAEGFVVTPAGRSKVWRYLIQLLSQRDLVARVFVTSVVLRVIALALPVLTGMVVDRVVPRGDHGLLFVIAIGISAVLAFQLLSSLIRSHLLLELRTRLDTRMTLGFVSHLLSLPYAYFNRRSAGDLLLRVSSNTQIRDLLTSSLLSTLLDGSLAIAYLALLFSMSWVLAVITLGAGCLQILVVLVSRHRYAALTAQDLESQARAHSYLVQMLVGIETLKVAGAEERALEHYANLYVDELNVSLGRGRLQAVLDGLNGLLQTAAPLILLGTGALLVVDGHLSLGTMLATSSLAAGFLGPLASLAQSAMSLQQLGSYVERIDDVLSASPEQVRGTGVVPPRLSGAIDLTHVSFRYGTADPLVVRDVSLSIAPGTTVAIVGRSGSGKSTLAALLLGLHKPTEGRIVYDGYDLAELDHKQLRQQLGMVPQTPFVFSGSIRNNIALTDPQIAFEKIVAAARKASIDVDIRAMPMGYETLVADGGATMSGGQRQRLALARALLHDPAILLLDEATSSLDATTERAVMDSLRKMRATRVIIAHRLSTIINADVIVVMDDGRVVETGKHHELVERGGVYAALVRDQTFSAGAS